MNILNNLKIEGAKERAIMLDIFFEENATQKSLVIFCHGFKGFKNWGHFDLIAETLAKAGFVCCKFNFSHNGGTEEQVIDFPDLEAFGKNNISIELEDLDKLLNAWEKSGAFIDDAEIDRTNISLIGHSRGGGTVILKAASDSRIKKLVTLAAIPKIGRWFESEKLIEQWRKEGVLLIPNGRTNQQMPMYFQYYKDFMQNKNRLDIPKAASQITIPWLIIHGSNDVVVKPKAAESLHEAASNSELFMLENGDHTFGGKHPWEENNLPDDAEKVMEKTIEFLK